MTWTKLSDDYSDDTWRLSDAAFRLHTEALVWNNRKLLDCLIPKDDLRRFAKNPEPVQELLAGEFWQDAGDSYLLIHHAQYQRDRSAVIKQQAANRVNGGKGGRPKGKPREQKTQSVSESQSDGSTKGFDPSTPPADQATLEVIREKTQSVSESQGGGESKRAWPGIEVGTSPQRSQLEQVADKAWLDYKPVPVGPASVPVAKTEGWCPDCGAELTTDYLRNKLGRCFACEAARVRA